MLVKLLVKYVVLVHIPVRMARMYVLHVRLALHKDRMVKPVAPIARLVHSPIIQVRLSVLNVHLVKSPIEQVRLSVAIVRWALISLVLDKEYVMHVQ